MNDVKVTHEILADKIDSPTRSAVIKVSLGKVAVFRGGGGTGRSRDPGVLRGPIYGRIGSGSSAVNEVGESATAIDGRIVPLVTID